MADLPKVELGEEIKDTLSKFDDGDETSFPKMLGLVRELLEAGGPRASCGLASGSIQAVAGAVLHSARQVIQVSDYPCLVRNSDRISSAADALVTAIEAFDRMVLVYIGHVREHATDPKVTC